jgi:putative membrane protein
MVRFMLAPLLVAVLLAPPIAYALGGGGLNDPQIAHIAYTAGEIDIHAAQLALKKSNNPDVHSFANEMIRDHTAVNQKALALVKKLEVKPEDNETSRSLMEQAKNESTRLSNLNGAAFDKAYAANEVAYHQKVNAALQNTLIPSATNPELKQLLSTGLKIFEGHQQHAEQLSEKLP